MKHLLTVVNSWEHLLCHLSEFIIRLLVVRLITLSYHAKPVDYENFTKRHTHIHVTHRICLSVTKTTVERLLVSREKLQYILETRYLEDLRLL